jgi:hypothetical protein
MSTHFYLLADAHGAVGAFKSEADAKKCADAYPNSPMITYKFPYADGEADATATAVDTIYFVLYREINAVAFASNSRLAAYAVHTELARVGLTYEDINAIDFWTCECGKIIGAAARRLAETCSSAVAADPLDVSDKKMMEVLAQISGNTIPEAKATGLFEPTPPERSAVNITECFVTYSESTASPSSSESAAASSSDDKSSGATAYAVAASSTGSE